VKIAAATGMEFAIDIAPLGATPKLVSKAVRGAAPHEYDGVSVLIAAARASSATASPIDAPLPDPVPKLDTGRHDRRMARRLQDPAYRVEFDLQRRRISSMDAVDDGLDQQGEARANLVADGE
jgi:hypothetical protein